MSDVPTPPAPPAPSPAPPQSATPPAPVGSLHIDHKKEQFSRAWAHAIATVAGYTLAKPEVDDDSVDFTICGKRTDGTKVKAPRLDIQLKCTETDDEKNKDRLAYALEMKNYNDLRGSDFSTARILVVVCVPPAPDHWLAHSDEQTILRRIAYWVSLRDAPEVKNEKTKTVHLPRSQRFNAEGLREIMARIGARGLP